jgi:hypothetical protein
MPPKQQKRRVNRRNVNQQNAITRVQGAVVYVSSVANTNNFVLTEVNLQISSLGARVIQIADCFQHWRMVNLSVHAMAASTTGLCSYCVAYCPIPTGNFTAATNFATLADFPEYDIGVTFTPARLRVNRAGLLGSIPSKWLETNTTDSPLHYSAGTYSVGLISATTDTTSNIISSLRFELEFRTPIDPALNPLFPLLRRPKNNPPKDKDTFDFEDVKTSTIV